QLAIRGLLLLLTSIAESWQSHLFPATQRRFAPFHSPLSHSARSSVRRQSSLHPAPRARRLLLSAPHPGGSTLQRLRCRCRKGKGSCPHKWLPDGRYVLQFL